MPLNIVPHAFYKDSDGVVVEREDTISYHEKPANLSLRQKVARFFAYTAADIQQKETFFDFNKREVQVETHSSVRVQTFLGHEEKKMNFAFTSVSFANYPDLQKLGRMLYKLNELEAEEQKFATYKPFL